MIQLAVFLLMITFNLIDGIDKSKKCSDEEQTPLCICRSTYRHSTLTDQFLAKLSLSQCDNSSSIRRCRQGRFHPLSFHLIQLIPTLANHSYCLDDIHCLHTLHSLQYCRRCQLSSSLITHTNTCFHLCEHDTSCGFLCLNRHVTVSINCKTCRGRRQTTNCSCLKVKQSPSCLQSDYVTTTPRWMQKDGFPAAAILALFIFVIALVIIAIRQIYRQIDLYERRRHGSDHRLVILRNQNPQQTKKIN